MSYIVMVSVSHFKQLLYGYDKAFNSQELLK